MPSLSRQLRAAVLTGVAGCAYPLGLFPGAASLARLGITPRTRATREAVVLVEGWGANVSTWIRADRRLTEQGFHVRHFGYATRGGSVEKLAERLAREVGQLSEAGFVRVHLVGHSLGGIIASLAATEFIDTEILGQVITVASPHKGSYLGRLPAGGLGAEVRPGAALLTRVRESVTEAVARGIRFTAVAAKEDFIVLARDARLEVAGVRNEELSGTHVSITFDDHLLDLVVEVLDEDLALAA